MRNNGAIFVLAMTVLLSSCGLGRPDGSGVFSRYGKIVFKTVAVDENAGQTLTGEIQDFYRNIGREMFYKILLADKASKIYLDNESNVRLDFPSQMAFTDKPEDAKYRIVISQKRDGDEAAYLAGVYDGDILFSGWEMRIRLDGDVYRVTTYKTYVTDSDINRMLARL